MMYKNTVFHFFLTVTCRERIIESMLKKDLLTPELRQECLYDANLGIRKMVEELFCYYANKDDQSAKWIGVTKSGKYYNVETHTYNIGSAYSNSHIHNRFIIQTEW